jgi:anti-sigma regulatory factor (Ser/Thr protein kinase)
MDRPELDSGAGTAFRCWPHVSGLEFSGQPRAVPCARLHTRQVLWEWGLDHLAKDAELLVSELMGNAVQASRSRDGATSLTALRLLADDARLIVEVWDQNPYIPQPRQAHGDDESGRGFMVIEAIASRWGYRRASASFKVVWAELPV